MGNRWQLQACAKKATVTKIWNWIGNGFGLDLIWIRFAFDLDFDLDLIWIWFAFDLDFDLDLIWIGFDLDCIIQYLD